MSGLGVDATLSFLCAAAASGGNATANVMQRKAGLQQPAERKFGVALLWDLVRSATWLIGFGGMVASFVLQAVALSLGQLSAVEPIITLEVPLTLLVASQVFRVQIGRAEWGGIWSMTIGMIVLVAALDPRPGDEAAVNHATYLAAGGGTALFVAALILFARRGGVLWRTACLGAAAGASFGLTATLIKEVTARLRSGGVLAILASWQTYAAAAVGIAGVVIMQWALHTGPLLAAQPGFTLLDPLVSILWGVLVYSEPVRLGAWLFVASLGAVGIAVGVLLLGRSPLLAGMDDHEPDVAGQPAPATPPELPRSMR